MRGLHAVRGTTPLGVGNKFELPAGISSQVNGAFLCRKGVDVESLLCFLFSVFVWESYYPLHI